MKEIEERVDIGFREGHPDHLWWRDDLYDVAEVGEHWHVPGPPPRTYFSVLLVGPGLSGACEATVRHAGDGWVLESLA